MSLFSSPAPASPSSGAGLMTSANGVRVLAVVISTLGVVIAAAAAMDRAGTLLDRLLLAATAVALALGAHLLPAWGRRQPGVYLLWLGCLAATLYGHAHFFAAAGARAGQLRAEEIVPSATEAALQAQLHAIQARSPATVAAEQAGVALRLAQAQAGWARCEKSPTPSCAPWVTQVTGLKAQQQALALELTQAQHGAALRQQLVALAQARDQAQHTAALDPVDRSLAAWTGWSASVVGLGSAIAQSLLLDLLAAALWVKAASPAAGRVAPSASTVAPPAAAPTVSALPPVAPWVPRGRTAKSAALWAAPVDQAAELPTTGR